MSFSIEMEMSQIFFPNIDIFWHIRQHIIDN